MPLESPSPRSTRGAASRNASRAQLARRRAAMPVIDAARVPWEVVRRRWPARAGWMFAWLHFIRPLVFVLLWLVLARYAWTHFFGLPDELPVWQQVTLYAVAVLMIVATMLALAPLRRREVRHEPTGDTQPATLDEMSEFSSFAPAELGELQHAQRVVMHHDNDGQPERAEDTGKLLARHTPGPR